MSLELVFGNELFDMGIIPNDPWELANRVGIPISSDKDLLASFIDLEELIVIAAVFESHRNFSYAFDVVVDPNYQRAGLGKELIDIAMQKFYEIRQSDPLLDLVLDVINPNLVPFLIREYNLEIVNEFNEHTILSEID